MQSPISGKEMKLIIYDSTLTVRKEVFPVKYHVLKCEDSGEEFETPELMAINLRQAMDQYRSKYNLPFPEEIREIREQYGVSAAKMSEILRLGINQFKQYEHGELPSESNASLILLARNPKDFCQLVEWSNLAEEEKKQLMSKAKILGETTNSLTQREWTTKLLMRSLNPDVERGFRRPDPYRFAIMTRFFASRLSTVYKTQMNKLLFYADFCHFRNHGRSISGSKYRAIAMGPVPDNFDSLFQFAENEGFVKLEHYDYDNGTIGTKFLPGEKDEALDDLETFSLESVYERFKNTKSQEIINISHNEDAWRKNVGSHALISYLESYCIKGVDNFS